MKITAELRAPHLDLQRLRQRLMEDMADGLTHAALNWIGAATSVIPVWSGASHATFLHLSREIGFQMVITPASNAPQRVNYGLRNSGGSFDIDANKGTISFTYETDLPHLVYNEYHNANMDPDPGLFARLLQPGPYNFQGRAAAAFTQSIGAVGLPDVRDFIKVRVKRVR